MWERQLHASNVGCQWKRCIYTEYAVEIKQNTAESSQLSYYVYEDKSTNSNGNPNTLRTLKLEKFSGVLFETAMEFLGWLVYESL